jgi:membrane associated rhomboid family serine protease
MIPISDENPTLRTPVMTYALLAAMVATWVWFERAGTDPTKLAASICNYGLVPAELTHGRPIGFAIPIGAGLSCAIDDSSINILTPILSMFLHGSWGHLIGNALYFWVCGLAAAAAHILVDPRSPVPTVGASGAISGILGAYLVLYPRVRVRYFVFLFFIRFPAWAALLWWFGTQVLTGLPQLNEVNPEVSGGVAVWAHVGGFVAGVLLVKLFENRDLVSRRVMVSDARGAWQ